MVDLADKRSESGDPATEEQAKKSCADCGTTKTPLWRGGPAGPKSLCNACGIKSRKKRRAILGMNKTGSEEKKRSKKATSTSKAMDLSLMMKRRSKMGQEEKAAVLLMALSYASVYAN